MFQEVENVHQKERAEHSVTVTLLSQSLCVL